MLSRVYLTESEIRKRQINTLKVFNDNVTEVQEGAEYQVSFNAGGKDLILWVTLGNDFPSSKPVLKVSPQIIHPWIKSDGEVISAPGLLNFTVHSDLGRVVQAIIREFERTPPPLVSETCNTVATPIANTKESEQMGRISPYFTTQFSPPSQSTLPNYQSVAFPELSSLSTEELQFLNESIEKQDDFLDNLPQSKETNKYLNDLIVQIEELAESNINKESELMELYKDIDGKIEDVTKLAFENERLNVSYRNLSDKYSPKNIKNILLQAAKEVNSESDKIAESFLKGEMDVEKFLTEYLHKRTLGQTRKTKEEKLTQQLQNLERAGF